MILLYHKIDVHAPTRWWVSADAFDRQLAALASREVVTLDRYDPSNPRHVVITFDGVYENVYRYAFPLLRKWGYPFELFMTGNYIGGDNAFDRPEPAARFCTLEQLRAMAAHGGRIQWHTASHRRLDTLTDEALQAELAPAAALAHAFSAPHLRWFAYPHGDYTERVLRAVQQRYDGALGSDFGVHGDRYQHPRLTVLEHTRLEEPTVSLIIANYNYGRFIAEAIDSALTQTRRPDQLLIIDDASTDHSRSVIESYRGEAELVFNEHNLGIVDNFNKAVSLARGDYVAILGADNRLRSDYVEACKAALDRNPRAGVAYTDMAIFGPRARFLADKTGAVQIGTSRSEGTPVYLWRLPDPCAETLERFAQVNFIHGSSMFRRAAFDDAGGYRSGEGAEDHGLFRRMLDRGHEAVRVGAPLLEYRQHSLQQANSVLGLQTELSWLRRDLKRTQAREREQWERGNELSAENTRLAAQLKQQWERGATLEQQLREQWERGATLEQRLKEQWERGAALEQHLKEQWERGAALEAEVARLAKLLQEQWERGAALEAQVGASRSEADALRAAADRSGPPSRRQA